MGTLDEARTTGEETTFPLLNQFSLRVGSLTIPPSITIGAVSIVLGLVVWQLVAEIFFTPFVLPSVSDVASRIMELIGTGELSIHIKASYLRIIIGFFFGSLLGALLGMIMGTIIHVRRLFEPLVNFLRFVPPIAWLAPVLIWFGIGETSKILLIVYTTSFMVLLNTMAGVMAVPLNQMRAARCFGASRLQIFRWILFPSTVPFIITGMYIGLTNSFATIVTAEMIAAQTGLGYLILVSRNFMATDTIFAGIITLGLLGLLTSRLFDFVSQRLAWRYYLR